ncbi:hypothetical protein Tco_0628382 [Tanacetum coccineum]|uniref:Uncharacterized protein n=1 Tax=Tanacetum coccineum TaxID=301880 RepID=A0ABQ4WQ38_9ASTR
MSTSKFAKTHNLVAFLEKPEESNGFEGIIDFLNASSIKYASTIQALVDKKKVIITEKSVRSDLLLEDAKGTECLPNDVMFEQLTLMGAKTTALNEFSSTMASAIILFLDKQFEGMSKHEGIYVTPSYTKKIFANMKREGKGFSRRITPLFQTMMVQAPEDMGKDSAAPTDSHSTPIITQPSSSKPEKKKSRRKQRKDNGPTQPIPDEATNEEPISTPSCDPPQSAKEIASLKKRVKQLEKRRKSRTSRLKRLRMVGSASRVESSNDVSLGAQEDASKQGRKIVDLDADAEVTLIDETQERFDEEMLFDVQDDLQGEKVVAKKEVAKKEAEEQAELEKERVAQEEASRAAIIEELDSIQVMIDVDEQLVARLQAEEQEQLSIEEKSRMLVEMIAGRKKLFAAQRAAE